MPVCGRQVVGTQRRQRRRTPEEHDDGATEARALARGRTRVWEAAYYSE